MIIPLSDDAYELLEMYALPHIHRDPPQPKNAIEAFRLKSALKELREKGMVREGIANTLPSASEVRPAANAEISQGELIARIKSLVKPYPGTVATRRGMEIVKARKFPNNPDAIAEMKAFVADEDPPQ